MALVRVYCGLASADPSARPAPTGATLTAAVVDDAGRLLHVREINDDPIGYARLGALLAERSSGPSDAAVAADSDDHAVVSLLSAAGRPLAIADDDLVDAFAEQFADDESTEEIHSPAAVRRAVGLARALQAGALLAAALPTPRELAGFKPILAAHSALANGRHAAAVALREVLRELYPAALRAYPDPAEPLSLAVLDALPEPGILTGPEARGREEGVAAHLVTTGVADPAAVGEAVTALRVAIAETPPRNQLNNALTAAVTETVRQAVAAVRACDSGCDALVSTLTARASGTPAAAAAANQPVRRMSANPPLPGPAAGRPVEAAPPGRATTSPVRPAEPVPVGRRRQPTATGAHPVVHPAPAASGSHPVVRPTPTGSNPLVRPTPSDGHPAVRPQPMTPPPVAPAPVAPPPTAPAPVAGRPAEPSAAAQGAGPVGRGPRPVSAPPTVATRPAPPTGAAPAAPARPSVPPAEAGEPFRPTLTNAALANARAERQRAVGGSARQATVRREDRPTTPRRADRSTTRREEPAPAPPSFTATDLSIPVPAPRPAAEQAPPGSRANWPLVPQAEDRPAGAGERPEPLGDRPVAGMPPPPAPSEGRVTPPWLADDLPKEPPTLRLVDSSLDDGLGGDQTTRRTSLTGESPSLRLVDVDKADPTGSLPPALPAGPDAGVPPVDDEGDGDLLIFAAARSAWFVGHSDDVEVDWSTTADTGWRAAEQAARPAVGAQTTAGLPKRVPQANLVPGSPLREERPLRIVRNAARLAENTTGYFQGWRRGQEIGGYAVGGRPGRESAGGWDFSRDHEEREEAGFGYRSAGYRS